MAGFITKADFFHIARTFGLRVAFRAIVTKQPTFLQFLQSENLI